MERLNRWIFAGLAAVSSATASAQAELGHAVPWQIGLQDAATPVAHGIAWLHNYLLIVITIITLFVMGLLIYVMVKFNAKANPVPSKTTHNTLIEVLWTVIPVLILVSIAIPSFRLLYLERDIPQADMTIKAIGNPGWNWTYQYPDLGLDDNKDPIVAFDSNLLDEAAAKENNEPYLLGTDAPVVVPVNKTVKMIVTSDPAGIIHAWTIPSFGMKIDAIPGRLNEDWFRAEKEGIYYGQCSELCGQNHAFMPIEVWVVSDENFKAWSDLVSKGADENTVKELLKKIKPAANQVAAN